MSGRLAAVFLQRLFDVVAIGRLKVAPFDARQALIEGELITRDRAVPVSPISKRSAALGFVGFLLQLTNARSLGPSLVGWAPNSPRKTPSALRIIFRQVS